MKNLTNSLVPLAALIFFGACFTSVLAFLAVLLTSFGFWEARPFFYFEQYNLPILSLALPIIGMLLYASILLGISGKREEKINPIDVQGSEPQVATDKESEEERPLKAA